MKQETKMKIYRFFGAEIFQKVVFKVEELKYLVIDKFFPNINDWYEKVCDKRYNKIIKKQNLESNEKLLKYFQNEKMKFRKENIYKQNRNYHYNPNHPTEFMNYLNFNKKVHVRGAIRNVVSLLIIGGVSLFLGYIPAIGSLLGIYEVISLFINLECVNLQNYNICRFENERTKKLLVNMEEKQIEKGIKKYGECIQPVSEVIHSQIELPTVDQVVDQITTHEQAVQLLNYAREQLSYMKNNVDIKGREKHL